METFEARLSRFLLSEVDEIPLTLLNSIDNFFLPQIQKAGKHKLEYPVLLGTHAIIQTVAGKIFGVTGLSGTKFYLREFVDAGPSDRTYSSISTDVHDLRNVVAHTWISSLGHTFVIDYTISGGFLQRGSTIHFNPTVYLQDFSAGFGADGRVWDFKNLVTDDHLLLRKYEFIAEWLNLPRNDPVRGQIQSLKAAAPGPARTSIETAIQNDIKTRYSL